MDVIKNERGIGTGQTRDGTQPQTDAEGKLPPSGSKNPVVQDPAGKTPGAAEGPASEVIRSGPGKTPGKAEG